MNYDYSMKNIPQAPKHVIEKMMVSSMESLVNRMRRKLFWYKSPFNNPNNKETFGFKSQLKAPPDPELKAFEKELFKMIPELEMKTSNNQLQTKMRRDKKIIQESKEVIVAADKTCNFYKFNVSEYKRMLMNNITKDYRKTNIEVVNKINREAAMIAKEMELEDRIEEIALRSAFITVKDHKPDWPARIHCRLINPTRSNIGIISKSILDRINKELRSILKINQWRSSQEVIDWFKNINNKEGLKFVKFDVDSFYPSITKELLIKVLDFTSNLTMLSVQERKVIMNARKNVLVDCDGDIWVKKTCPDFDVTMGSYDGAECCELVGIYLLNKMGSSFAKDSFGLYRDDGLMVVRGGGPAADRARKEVIKLFNDEQLKITTEANLERVDFLDIVLDLRRNKTKPYIKPNAGTKYISTESSHPPAIKKSIPSNVAKRLSRISSNREEFQQEVQYYQAAIDKSGYKENLEYIPEESIDERQENINKKNQRKAREVIFFNPPWSNNVRTNIGRKFLGLIKKHFPKSNPLYKLFNTKKVKVSYRTTSNMGSLIRSHNNKVLSRREEGIKEHGCNCRVGEEWCPMRGECLEPSMIYKAEVVSGKGKRHYYGQTDRTFKERFYGHSSDLRHPSKAKSTSLSTYVWKIRNEGEDPTISWSKVKNARSYNPGNKNCNMCLEEKTTIARDKTKEMLNKRSELMYKCLHKQRYLLENIVQMQVHEENDREHQEHAQEADVDHHSVNHVLQQEDHVQDGVVDHHSSYSSKTTSRKLMWTTTVSTMSSSRKTTSRMVLWITTVPTKSYSSKTTSRKLLWTTTVSTMSCSRKTTSRMVLWITTVPTKSYSSKTMSRMLLWTTTVSNKSSNSKITVRKLMWTTTVSTKSSNSKTTSRKLLWTTTVSTMSSSTKTTSRKLLWTNTVSTKSYSRKTTFRKLLWTTTVSTMSSGNKTLSRKLMWSITVSTMSSSSKSLSRKLRVTSKEG